MRSVRTDAQLERVGPNQALFREVNERVAEVSDAFDAILPLGRWVCECANDECTQPLELTHEEYETIRRDGTTFLVFPDQGHVFPDAERVIERHERYWVVQKVGVAARRVEQQNPRG